MLASNLWEQPERPMLASILWSQGQLSSLRGPCWPATCGSSLKGYGSGLAWPVRATTHRRTRNSVRGPATWEIFLLAIPQSRYPILMLHAPGLNERPQMGQFLVSSCLTTNSGMFFHPSNWKSGRSRGDSAPLQTTEQLVAPEQPDKKLLHYFNPSLLNNLAMCTCQYWTRKKSHSLVTWRIGCVLPIPPVRGP
jgi:hypothetical protein